MGKVTVDISMSPDGFIAGPNDGRDTGAVVLGRRMFDNAKGWGDDPPFHMPVFVLTHDAREKMTKEGGTTFTFVTDGIDSALEQARAAAGDKDISVAGGAKTIQQYLRLGSWTRYRFTSCPYCSTGASLCSTRSILNKLSWKQPGWSNPLASRISNTAS